MKQIINNGVLTVEERVGSYIIPLMIFTIKDGYYIFYSLFKGITITIKINQVLDFGQIR